MLDCLCSLQNRLSTPPAFNRADYADSEQIEDLLSWTHPHLESSFDSGPPGPKVVTFTESENAAMLRLPRKECKTQISFHFHDDKKLNFCFHLSYTL
jgi:hypothetical protein